MPRYTTLSQRETNWSNLFNPANPINLINPDPSAVRVGSEGVINAMIVYFTR